VAAFNFGVKLWCVRSLSERKIAELLTVSGLGKHAPSSREIKRLTSWLCAFTCFRLDLFEPRP
jgi:hypothetical protein